MSEPYWARAYGLTFSSLLPLPELVPCEPAAPDVEVVLGAVPDQLDEPSVGGVLYDTAPGAFLLRMRGLGRYLVTGGDRIVVDIEPGADLGEVRVFLLGACMGALLHQRELLVLHAAAVATESGAVLLAGASGAGKSTLLGELLNRGYSMIVDDVCAVDLGDDLGDSAGQARPRVLPGYPRTRLWADAASHLDVETADLVRTRPTIEKFERQIPERFHGEPSALRAIYVLRAHNGDFEQSRSDPIDAFAVVLHQTYRQAFLDGLEMRRAHFAITSAVAAQVPITTVMRPRDVLCLTELADLVEADLEA